MRGQACVPMRRIVRVPVVDEYMALLMSASLEFRATTLLLRDVDLRRVTPFEDSVKAPATDLFFLLLAHSFLFGGSEFQYKYKLDGSRKS